MNMYRCKACFRNFDSQRELSCHTTITAYCRDTLEQSNQAAVKYYNHEQQDDKINTSCTTNSSTINNISELQNTNNDNFSESDKLEYSETVPISNDILHKIKLLKIINDIGMPLYLYKEIMEWAKDAYLSDYKFGSGQKSYKQTIKFLQQKLNFQTVNQQN